MVSFVKIHVKPGAHIISFNPFISWSVCFPWPRTCLKTMSFFLGLVTRWSFQYCFKLIRRSIPPGLFSHEFEADFILVSGIWISCTVKPVVYFAIVRFWRLRCLHRYIHIVPKTLVSYKIKQNSVLYIYREVCCNAHVNLHKCFSLTSGLRVATPLSITWRRSVLHCTENSSVLCLWIFKKVTRLSKQWIAILLFVGSAICS